MSTTTVQMPEEDYDFLRSIAERDGTSPEAFIAKQVRLMRERFQRPLHPDVVALSGIIKGDVDEKKEYYVYMEKKHS